MSDTKVNYICHHGVQGAWEHQHLIHAVLPTVRQKCFDVRMPQHVILRDPVPHLASTTPSTLAGYHIEQSHSKCHEAVRHCLASQCNSLCLKW